MTGRFDISRKADKKTAHPFAERLQAESNTPNAIKYLHAATDKASANLAANAGKINTNRPDNMAVWETVCPSLI